MEYEKMNEDLYNDIIEVLKNNFRVIDDNDYTEPYDHQMILDFLDESQIAPCNYFDNTCNWNAPVTAIIHSYGNKEDLEDNATFIKIQTTYCDPRAAGSYDAPIIVLNTFAHDIIETYIEGVFDYGDEELTYHFYPFRESGYCLTDEDGNEFKEEIELSLEEHLNEKYGIIL